MRDNLSKWLNIQCAFPAPSLFRSLIMPPMELGPGDILRHRLGHEKLLPALELDTIPGIDAEGRAPEDSTSRCIHSKSRSTDRRFRVVVKGGTSGPSVFGAETQVYAQEIGQT